MEKRMHIPIVMFFAVCFSFLILSSPSAYSGVVHGNDSIYTFNVTDCASNVTFVGCNATTIRFNCSITPYNFIDAVQFYIDGAYYTTSRNQAHFYYDFNKPIDYADVDDTISMERQKITDVDNKSVLDFEVVDVTHQCDVCDATYNVTYGTCYTNNTRDAYYISNDPCAPDFNTTAYCNYCDPDWVQRSGGIYDCNSTNQQYVYYDDFNGCYAVTGLLEDAPPSDHDSVQSCSFYTTDMVCNVDAEPFLTKKVNVICNIPSAYSNETFKCLTYVKPTLNDTNILQSNPEYKKLGSGTSIIGFVTKEEEDREYFTPQGSILNAYYTDKNIETDRQFIVGVQCSSSSGTLVSEYPVTPTYRGLNPAVNRFVWLKDNAPYVALILFVGFILVGLFVLMLRKAVSK